MSSLNSFKQKSPLQRGVELFSVVMLWQIFYLLELFNPTPLNISKTHIKSQLPSFSICTNHFRRSLGMSDRKTNTEGMGKWGAIGTKQQGEIINFIL